MNELLWLSDGPLGAAALLIQIAALTRRIFGAVAYPWTPRLPHHAIPRLWGWLFGIAVFAVIWVSFTGIARLQALGVLALANGLPWWLARVGELRLLSRHSGKIPSGSDWRVARRREAVGLAIFLALAGVTVWPPARYGAVALIVGLILGLALVVVAALRPARWLPGLDVRQPIVCAVVIAMAAAWVLWPWVEPVAIYPMVAGAACGLAAVSLPPRGRDLWRAVARDATVTSDELVGAARLLTGGLVGAAVGAAVAHGQALAALTVAGVALTLPLVRFVAELALTVGAAATAVAPPAAHVLGAAALGWVLTPGAAGVLRRIAARAGWAFVHRDPGSDRRRGAAAAALMAALDVVAQLVQRGDVQPAAWPVLLAGGGIVAGRLLGGQSARTRAHAQAVGVAASAVIALFAWLPLLRIVPPALAAGALVGLALLAGVETRPVRALRRFLAETSMLGDSDREPRDAAPRLARLGLAFGLAGGAVPVVRSIAKDQTLTAADLLATPPGGSWIWLPAATAVLSSALVLAAGPTTQVELVMALRGRLEVDTGIAGHARRLLLAACPGAIAGLTAALAGAGAIGVVAALAVAAVLGGLVAGSKRRGRHALARSAVPAKPEPASRRGGRHALTQS